MAPIHPLIPHATSTPCWHFLRKIVICALLVSRKRNKLGETGRFVASPDHF